MDVLPCYEISSVELFNIYINTDKKALVIKHHPSYIDLMYGFWWQY